jgi:hypothetical protein
MSQVNKSTGNKPWSKVSKKLSQGSDGKNFDIGSHNWQKENKSSYEDEEKTRETNFVNEKGDFREITNQIL